VWFGVADTDSPSAEARTRLLRMGALIVVSSKTCGDTNAISPSSSLTGRRSPARRRERGPLRPSPRTVIEDVDHRRLLTLQDLGVSEMTGLRPVLRGYGGGVRHQARSSTRRRGARFEPHPGTAVDHLPQGLGIATVPDKEPTGRGDDVRAWFIQRYQPSRSPARGVTLPMTRARHLFRSFGLPPLLCNRRCGRPQAAVGEIRSTTAGIAP